MGILEDDNAAVGALDAAGVTYRVILHGPAASLAEAARARGVEPADVVKTLVVRRGDDDSRSRSCPATGPPGRSSARRSA